jgi:mycofactocin precursor peptide peptidase
MDDRLGTMTSPDVPIGATLVVAVGAVEQHGPHLPLDTDGRVAAHLAGTLVAARPKLLAGPALPYGASGEHEGFAGTVSIGTAALTHLLVELTRSATRWAGRVLFVNGHGGNVEALRAAVALLRREGRDAAWWSWTTPGGDAHAGWVETALLLHLDGDAVRLERAAPGNCRPLEELLPALRRGGVAAVSPTGVLGDPTAATAALGADLRDDLAADLLAAADRWAPDSGGRLTAPVPTPTSTLRDLPTATDAGARSGR